MITKTSNRSQSNPLPPPSAASSPPRTDSQTYHVQKGDNLSKILMGANPGISGRDLQGLIAQTARMNGLADPNKILAGQKLQIPAFDGARATANASVIAESRYSETGRKQFGEAPAGPKEAEKAKSAAGALLQASRSRARWIARCRWAPAMQVHPNHTPRLQASRPPTL